MKSFSSLKQFNIKRATKLPTLGVSPETDWEIIFTVSSIIVLIVILICVLTFFRVNKGDIYTSINPDGSDKPFNIEAIKKDAAYYEEKAANFASIKNSSSTAIVDPSI